MKHAWSALLLLSLGTPALAQESIVTNGGFESPVLSPGSWSVYPSVGQWCATARMSQNRYGHTATVLQDGRVLLTSGFSTASQYTSEVFSP
ncbi:hypothetical protein [Archangium violaceum]|uniref:hypothetical protein n=1 Tax=Archangium violaceum TaxID=83451 RepID=UPI0036DE9AA9